MKFEELKSNLKSCVKPIYLIEGEEAFFRNRSVELIKEAVLAEPSLNYAAFRGADIKADPSVIVSALLVCPFMSEKRVIRVDEWYPSMQELKGKALGNYFNKPSDTSVLLIVNEKNCEALKKQSEVTVIDCGRASEELAVRFIRGKALKNNIVISNSVCRLICEYCMMNLLKINTEVDKLIDYSCGEGVITETAVKNMVSRDAEYKTFEIVDFICRKDYANAYKILEEIRTPNEKILLMGSLYNHFRVMFYVKTSKLPVKKIADYMGLREFIVRKTAEQASDFTAKRIRRIMDKLAENDSGFKSGELSLDNAFANGIMNVLIENK